MTSISRIRILRDLKEMKENPKEMAQLGIHVDFRNDRNLYHLKGCLKGPPDSAYEGGIFNLLVDLPQDYPMRPPKVNMVTKIFHPNISSSTGQISLDRLGADWLSSTSLRVLLLSIQALLGTPNFRDTIDVAIQRMYTDSTSLFLETAQYWTQWFACGEGGLNASFEKKRKEVMRETGKPPVRQLHNLDQELFNETARYWSQWFASAGGQRKLEFNEKRKEVMRKAQKPEDVSIIALSYNAWNVENALEWLKEQ